MTDQKYSQAVESFANALSLFAERTEGLTKRPLDVPEISESSDNAEKREALRRMLNSLASTDDEAALSDSEIMRAAAFFSRLYGGEEPYRHRYADICELIFSKLGQSNGELDDGVPYSVNCLAESIRIIHSRLVEMGSYGQAKSILKLADHIDLEKTRLSHYIEQQQTMREFKAAIASVKDEKAKAEEERAELEREFDERLDKTRMEYIAILGVFAAVVLAFNGGVGFSTATMTAIGSEGNMRALVFLTALVGFVLINTISVLLVFIWKMSFNQRKVDLGNWPRNCLIFANVVLVLIMVATVVLEHPFLRGLIGLY